MDDFKWEVIDRSKAKIKQAQQGKYYSLYKSAENLKKNKAIRVEAGDKKKLLNIYAALKRYNKMYKTNLRIVANSPYIYIIKED